MDADTLVRHKLPVVMICGNNGIRGLDKHPMRLLYRYNVAADLLPCLVNSATDPEVVYPRSATAV